MGEIKSIVFDWICISPGPETPRDAGISAQLVKEFYQVVPILGVCLGMQVINEVFGGKTDLAPVPMHGKKDFVYHDGKGIFLGVPSPFQVARYHSLQCKPVASCLDILAKSKDGVVMSIAHPQYPLYGVQFHPESFMCDYGKDIIKNFLNCN